MKYSPEGLAKAGVDLVPPFTVELALDPEDGDEKVEDLTLSEVARVLPGRRLSGLGTFRDQPVFAKLFYGPGARRYWLRELSGAERLQKSGVSTPHVSSSGTTADGQGYVVLYQAVQAAEQLQEDNVKDMAEATREIAQLHDANLLQTDIHLANFLVQEGRVLMVDADGIRPGHLLRQQFNNFALFLAQRAPWLDPDIPDFWQIYAGKRGEYVANMSSSEQIQTLTREQRQQRVNAYLKKCERQCSEFIRRKSWRRDFLCRREHWPRLQRFMIFPEEYVQEGTPLKLGNSSTVIRCEIDDERYVIKRYNIKGWSHRVRRWFKRRGRNAWKNGNWLAFLGIPSAQPLALLEQRVGWFAGVTYLVMADEGDRDLAQVLSTEPEALERVGPQVVELLKRLKSAGIRHGDLKATNFIERIGADRQDMVLIDYDALSHGGNSSDIARFMANWDDLPELKGTWQKWIDEAGL